VSARIFTAEREELVMIRSMHALKALASGFRLIRDPNRLAEVFEIADHLLAAAPPARTQQLVEEVKRSPEGARALADKPRVGSFDLAELAKLPEGTLGRVFADHMRANNLDPSALPKIPGGTELEFFRAHLYETHDILHVVTGFGTNVADELGLQAFYLAQFPGGLPPALLAGGLLNTMIYAIDQRDVRMRAIVRGWLLGKRARPFFGVRWGDLWAVPLADVRASLGIDIPSIEQSLPSPEVARAA
jgi:ubiquinone biosynthesis protein COQ4